MAFHASSSSATSTSLFKAGLVAFAFLLSLNTAEAASIGEAIGGFFKSIFDFIDHQAGKLYDFGRNNNLLGRWFSYFSWEDRKAIKKAELMEKLVMHDKTRGVTINEKKFGNAEALEFWAAKKNDAYNEMNRKYVEEIAKRAVKDGKDVETVAGSFSELLGTFETLKAHTTGAKTYEGLKNDLKTKDFYVNAFATELKRQGKV